MMNRTWKLGVLLLAVGLTVACGDDPETSSNNAPGTNNDNNTTGTSNNSNNTTGPNNSNNTPGTSNNSNNTNGPGSNNSNNNNMTPEPTEAPPTCADATPPERCAVDPANQVWAPASIVDSLAIEGTDCCFDFDGDGEPNNTLGGIISLIPNGNVNEGIQGSIDDGDIAILLEHQGLEDLTADEDFTINFWLGVHPTIPPTFDPTGIHELAIDPASIDEGAQPQAYVPEATLAASALTAGPGTVKLSINLVGAPIDLTLTGARVEAEVDEEASDLAAGAVALIGPHEGRATLGGMVHLHDLFAGLNTYVAGSCQCLGIEGDLISYDDTQIPGTCAVASDTSSCDSGCSQIYSFCGTIADGGLLADIDTDGDGEKDSATIGASFTALGADITGVAAPAN